MSWGLSGTSRLGVVFLVVLSVLSLAGLGSDHVSVPGRVKSLQPLLIREGPIGVVGAASGAPFWFQQGAIGDPSTYDSVGASVTIRTVYDKVNNDAHSYWVGSLLSNGAFVQVGYYNGLTTTNQYYCCAWFYEFFPPQNFTSPPIIGPVGSAGPIGSWHTYSMNYTGNGVWSFFIDNQLLGTSTPPGQKFNLGSGAANSGQNAVAALSEVAQTTGTTDIIGPAEFKNFQYEKSPNGWQPVPVGKTHVGYGGPPNPNNPPNPYSVAEISGTQNDFLTGSNIPYPGPDQCGNRTPNGSNLWSTLIPSCIGNNWTTPSLSFVDRDGNSLTPAWISLSDSTGLEIFLTSYQSQNVPPPSGQWTINQISWHATNVTTRTTINSSATSQTVPTNVFSIQLQVVGYFYSIPVKNATVILYLPDSTNETSKTDSNGQITFTQLPPSTYPLHIGVPYGIPSNAVQTINGPGPVVAKVFSLPELITLVLSLIVITITIAAMMARKERQRVAMVQAQPEPPQAIGSAYCRSCGQPVSPGANFCTSCGTPTRIMTQ